GPGASFLSEIIDGVILVGDTYDLLRLRGAPVPTLVGVAAADSTFPFDWTVPASFGEVVAAVFGADQVAAYEALYPPNSYATDADRINAFVDGSALPAWYPGIAGQLAAIYAAADYADPRDRVNDAFNDSFACLKQQIAQLMSEAKGGAPVYWYVFSYQQPFDRAYHGFDQFFLFGSPPPRTTFTDAEAALADAYETTWVRFMQKA